MSDYAEIRDGLGARAERLQRRLRGLVAGAHEVDLAASETDSSAAALAKIVGAATSELELIENALKRLEQGKFGVCERCAERIGLQRLELLPYATKCERCAPGLDLDAFQQLSVHHLGLEQLLRSIQAALGEALSGPDESARERCRILLADLAQELPEHFALEESRGYMTDVLNVAPGLGPRAEALQAEHTRFHRLSAELTERARVASQSGEWAELAEHFASLAAGLTTHEEAENAMVREAFTRAPGRAE